MIRLPSLDRYWDEMAVGRDLLRDDAVVRLAGCLLLYGLIGFWAGIDAAWMLVCLTLLVEAAHYGTLTFLLADRKRLTKPRAAALWLLNQIHIAIFILPGLILAAQPSVPMAVAGLLWLLGNFLHNLATLQFVPSQAFGGVPQAIGAVMIYFALVSGMEYPPAARIDWLMPAVLMPSLFGVMFKGYVSQARSVASLNETRVDVQNRLETLEHLVDRDPLTNLFNRRAFDAKLREALSANRSGTLIIVDLDGFKPINDSYSHAAGDAAIAEIAARLCSALGDHPVARIGGDEFAALVLDRAGSGNVAWIVDAILKDVARPIVFGDRELLLSASIGYQSFADGTVTTDRLIGNVDQAMYMAKAGGGNRAVEFDPRRFPARLTLEDRSRLLAAIEAGEIAPHYQPRVDLRDGRLLGFEALARWTSAEVGTVMPGQFLPQIDELGLTGEFTAHMVKRVIGDVGDLIDRGLDPGLVSVNLPEVSLTGLSGRNDVIRALRSAPRVCPHLMLEITEDVFIARSPEMVSESIASMRATGAKISLDDFGTGFASFQNLRQLDYDELKIDREFVAALGEDSSADVLVRGFLDIARGLGVEVIAEGVETEAQREILLEMGCIAGQGYLFGRAMPLSDAEVLIETQSVPPAAVTGRPKHAEA